ncbi:MAG TPA: hypothetical protein VFT91_03830 [Dehalococcoidia bacterium]|nr:hypothetical protein [Dehalococcoidia bacterium]
MLLHVLLNGGGGAGFPLVGTAVLTFLFVFIASFTLGTLPEGTRRLSVAWLRAWFKASLPRLIVAAAFSVALFSLATLLGGGSSGGDSAGSPACDSGLASLTGQAVTAARLQAAVSAMRQVADAAAAGDLDGAAARFYRGDTHNVTHDIDAPLRATNADLAKQLCLSVLVLERQFAGKRDRGVIAKQARTSAGLLERAGQQLGLGQ